MSRFVPRRAPRPLVRPLGAAALVALAAALAGCGVGRSAPTAAPAGASPAPAASSPGAAASSPGAGASSPAPGGSEPTPGAVPPDRLQPLAAVVRAADVARDAGTAKIAMTVEMTGAGSSLELTSEGETDVARGLARMTTTLPLPNGPTITMQQVVTPKAVYIQADGPGFPVGRWVEVPLDGLAEAGLTQGSTDPTAALEMLRGVADDVAQVGTERIRGRETTQYSGHIDLAKALAQAPPAAREQVRAYLDSLADRRVPFDVYLDAQGRLARLVQDLTMQMPTGEQATVTAVIDMYDWGSPVRIRVPAAAQVLPLSELRG